MPIGAVVLDSDFEVRVWNDTAAETWGLRGDEVVGKSFFALDIGLPVKELRNMVRAVSRGKPVTDEVIVDAVNRRGRAIKCRVTASILSAARKDGGVVILIEEMKKSG